MAELLFELGTEELPARFVAPALAELQAAFTTRCAELGLTHGTVRALGTPRRLALVVNDVADRTQDVVKDVMGPSVKAAFDDQGQPKTPAIKFAQGQGVAVEALLRVTTPRGEYLAAKVEEKGKRAQELLADVLSGLVHKLSFPKSMRWGDVDLSFARPLHWIVALLDGEVVPVVFADVKSGRQTRGHRFLTDQPISLEKPADYEGALERAHVIVDPQARRALLLERLEQAAQKAGGRLLMDEALVDQVLHLVELPCPVVGAFDARHLDLPPEVLIQEMKSHQRYFSLVDDNGKLLPRFIAVSNTPVKDEAVSVKGYERVLQARLSDGRFFFDEDRRTRLIDRVPRLHRVTWQQKLKSTWAEKVDRFRALAVTLAQKTGHQADQGTIERAATLAKADLVTGMVGEFPELQGVMGREYALHDGEPQAVALAIFEHYLPKGAGDALPTGDPGALIGIADRLDSICGLFGVGDRPTGAKDQYGLRRAALAIIHIVLGRGYRFSLGQAVDEALALLEPKLAQAKRKAGEPPVRDQVLDFFRGRLDSLWREGNRPDVVDAVLAQGFDDLVQAHARLAALSAQVGKGDFAPLAATFKRVANIVEKQARDVTPGPVDAARLVEAEEKALFAALESVRERVQQAVAKDDFVQAMEQVVTLKPGVDTFFDKVMVMAEDPKLKENRVRLLMAIGGLFGAIADFSRLQAES